MAASSSSSSAASSSGSITTLTLARPILSTGGFNKLYYRGEEGTGEKRRLYEIENTEEKVILLAKEAIQEEIENKGREYLGNLDTFESDIRVFPFLLKEAGSLRLISNDEAFMLQSSQSRGALELLEKNHINTTSELIEFYNQARSNSETHTMKALLPIFDTLLGVFQTERRIPAEQNFKTITLLANCEDDDIRAHTLKMLVRLCTGPDLPNSHQGYGLKYFIDNLTPEFLKSNQLLLITSFSQLLSRFGLIEHSGKSVNHEIEPLTASLVSLSRALVLSGIKGLNKEAKKIFYEALKEFYRDEKFTKRLTGLDPHTNYLLVFDALWTIQHLIRIPSDEHEVVTALRKAAEGLYALKKLSGAPLKAAVELFQHGILPDESLIPELRSAYNHGKKAFGIKDIPRPWYEVLEYTEGILLNPDLTEDVLNALYAKVRSQGERERKFHELIAQKLKGIVGKDKVSLDDTKEFAFGFVKQLSDVAMDHQNPNVRYRAIEILNEISLEEGQSFSVCLFILTTFQNIIDKKGESSDLGSQLIEFKKVLLEQRKDLVDVELFRKSKFSCLSLIRDDSSLLDAVKAKLKAVSEKKESLPTSRYRYGNTSERVFKKTITIKGNFRSAVPDMSREAIETASREAAEVHAAASKAAGGRVDSETIVGNKSTTTYEENLFIKGDFFG